MRIALPALILALMLAAAGCLVAGLHLLFGLGWALIGAAPCLLGLACVFVRGMSNA